MIIAVMLLPAALGFTALVAEGGLWYADHHQLRNIADAGALAAGWARREGADQFDAALAAIPDVGYNPDTDDVDVVSPPTSGPQAGDPQAIEVIVHRARPALISRLFLNSKSVDIEATATVRLNPESAYCVLALHPTASAALRLQGTADVNLNGCGVNVNSNSSSALDLGGASLMNVSWAEVTGGIVTNGGGTLLSTDPPETGMTARPDPYATLQMPSASPCTYTNLNVSGTVTLTPGRYCGGISIGSHAVVTMKPGTYIVDGGSLKINSGAVVAGSGVTFALTGSGTNYATVTINGGASVHLTAPTTGPYTGIAFMQDRNAPSSGVNKFNGGSGMDIEGIIYSPNDLVQFTGGNTLGSACTRIIASLITFTGNASVGDDCSGLGLSNEIDDVPQLVS